MPTSSRNKITYIFTKNNIYKIDRNKQPKDNIHYHMDHPILILTRYTPHGLIKKIISIPIKNIIEIQEHFIINNTIINKGD